MGAKATFWAWEQTAPTGAKMVLLALADTANDDGECWPGRKFIAEKCGMTDRTVTTHIKTLEGLGLVNVEPRPRDDGSQASNLYRLPVTQTRRVAGNIFHGGLEEFSTLEPTQSEPTPETTLTSSATHKGAPDFEKLITEFQGTFDEAQVREHIADALAHTSAKKWTDKTRYCRNWLKRAAERPTNGTQRANAPLSQFTRGAAGNQAPAGTDSEWWRRVGRYQTNG